MRVLTVILGLGILTLESVSGQPQPSQPPVITRESLLKEYRDLKTRAEGHLDDLKKEANNMKMIDHDDPTQRQNAFNSYVPVSLDGIELFKDTMDMVAKTGVHLYMELQRHDLGAHDGFNDEEIPCTHLYGFVESFKEDLEDDPTLVLDKAKAWELYVKDLMCLRKMIHDTFLKCSKIEDEEVSIEKAMDILKDVVGGLFQTRDIGLRMHFAVASAFPEFLAQNPTKRTLADQFVSMLVERAFEERGAKQHPPPPPPPGPSKKGLDLRSLLKNMLSH